MHHFTFALLISFSFSCVMRLPDLRQECDIVPPFGADVEGESAGDTTRRAMTEGRVGRGKKKMRSQVRQIRTMHSFTRCTLTHSCVNPTDLGWSCGRSSLMTVVALLVGRVGGTTRASTQSLTRSTSKLPSLESSPCVVSPRCALSRRHPAEPRAAERSNGRSNRHFLGRTAHSKTEAKSKGMGAYVNRYTQHT